VYRRHPLHLTFLIFATFCVWSAASLLDVFIFAISSVSPAASSLDVSHLCELQDKDKQQGMARSEQMKKKIAELRHGSMSEEERAAFVEEEDKLAQIALHWATQRLAEVGMHSTDHDYN
jgi:hypothetical protein